MAVIGSFLVLIFVPIPILIPEGSLEEAWLGWVGAIVSIGLYIWYVGWLAPGQHRRRMHAVAMKRGIRPIRCLRCDYDLHYIDSVACPECGQRFPGTTSDGGPATKPV
ncbi:MAG: hypothetical protein AAF612_12310 [Planctomycetota bacterium]